MKPRHRLLILDDDPTGSQCVADIDVAFDTDPGIATEALSRPEGVCFVLTNTRALTEAEARVINRGVLSDILTRVPDPASLTIVSRSDSTLRGHVIAEPTAICDELASHGLDVDGILLCPAMLEAGRFTENDTHYATVNGKTVAVGQTSFADDATFGYDNSNLPAFLEERSGGVLTAENGLFAVEGVAVGCGVGASVPR